MDEKSKVRERLQEAIEVNTVVIRAFSNPLPLIEILQTSPAESLDARLAKLFGCPESYCRLLRKHPLDLMTPERLDAMRAQLQLSKEQLASLDD